MTLRANILAIAVVGSSLFPLIAHGQITIADRTQPGTGQNYAKRFGISRPLPQDASSTGAWASLKLSSRQGDDSSHSSRTQNVIVGGVVGAVVGFGAGLLIDHAAKRDGTRSGDHISYTYEIITIPLGVVIGGLIGLFIPH